MNNVDKQYLDILKDVLENGSYKQTRSGGVYSLFGKSMRFNLKEGLPLLTTKKVFTKGIIHELLWFLNGDTNIKYLVENNVHIWDGDSYRHYLELVNKHNELCDKRDEISKLGDIEYFYERLDDRHTDLNCGGTIIIQEGIDVSFDDDDENDYSIEVEEQTESLMDFGNRLEKITPISKDEFLIKVQNEDYFTIFIESWDEMDSLTISDYKYGELGPVYGQQWRNFGGFGIDQIQNLIDMLKTNPDDRRLLCMAWNPVDMKEMALPPCHYGFQLYTRELTKEERLEWLCNQSDGEYDEWKTASHEKLDDFNVPKRELSLSFSMRSNDFCCGNPYNITQYSLLAYVFCEICNMVPGELIYNGGDVHVYENHVDAAREQLSRSGSDKIPTFRFARNIDSIDDLRYEDFIIENYEPDAPIKYELNVG